MAARPGVEILGIVSWRRSCFMLRPSIQVFQGSRWWSKVLP
ncbi:hypothetical protein ABZ557_13985 [Streptomyces sp. NPDC019645]